jgi:streptogramin lyase
MFSRFSPMALTRVSQDRRAVHEGRRTRQTRFRHPGRTRARFRLEGLEERCLLSGISSITEFPLPSPQGQGNLTGITVGPDGNLWFTDWGDNSIGMINPNTHAISLFPIPTAGAGPEGITVGPDGNLWFTEWFITKNNTNQIGEINPTTHAISEFVVPRDMVHPDGITAGPDGNLWFTCEADPYVASFNLTTHAVTQYPTTNGDTHSITAGPNGNLWFGTNHGSVDEINPSTGAQADVAANLSGAAPGSMGITTGPDGNIWVTSETNVVAMINPTTGASSQFTIPTANAGSYAITSGPDGNLWFTDINDGQIDSINPTTDAITTYAVPFGGTELEGITAGPDGTLWFTDAGNNAIGVATLTANQLAVTAQPPASVTAGSGFGLTVTAENSSGNPITSFDGTVTVALASNPGGATLGGTLTATASNGVATFSGLTLTTADPGYTLDVSASGLGAGVTSSITVTPATASQVVITTQPPSSVTAGSSFGVQASIEDAYGNVETSASNAVSVALATNPTGTTLGGTLSATASDGVATFSGLTLTKAASGYTLQVSSSGLTGATTSAIAVTPAAATQVVITQEPPASVALNASFALIAAIEDAYGNVVTSATDTVKVALDNNPTGAKLGGTLSEKASDGVATFSRLTLSKVGTGYTLELTSSGLTTAVTSPISVTSNGADVVLAPPGGTGPPDPSLAPLVLDSLDVSSISATRKHAGLV